MQNVLPDSDYQKINSFIIAKLGLNFPIERKGELAKALYGAALEFSIKDISGLINYLTTSTISKKEFQILSKHLTIGETYFFREKVIFEILRNILIPEIISGRGKENKRLKIWSAGCSSGEEAYSIAILINEMMLNKSDWNITILATDINSEIMKKAQNGNYSEWSFRDVNKYIKDKYFTKESGNRYSILPQIKEMVEFNQLNLVEDSFPALINKTNAVDIIFCRNVLMYFEPKKREKVISAFYNSLVTGGWLVLGLTEIGYMSDKRFKTISLKDAIIFQKPAQTIEIPKRKIPSIPKVSKEKKKNNYNKVSGTDGSQNRKIKKNTADSENDYYRAKQLFLDGNYNEAAKLFIRHIEQYKVGTKENDIGPGRAYYYLSMSLANIGRLSSALEWCERGIEIYKLDTALYFLKSNLLQGLNEYENAVDVLKKTIYLDSDYIMAHFSLGNIYKRLGRNNEADRQFKKLLIILNLLDDEMIIKDSEGMTVSRIKHLVNTFIHNAIEN